LKAAMQYFVQAFLCRHAFPEKYDLLMDIATEEFSHLEIVGATITMLLDGVNGELKDAAEKEPLTHLMQGASQKEQYMHEALTNPQFLVLTGGGPSLTNSQGVPWSAGYIHANGDLTVDLRSNIAAESRAKIVYEYLLKFTDDKYVHETLRFLMTREVTHFQIFSALLETIQPNFPPGTLAADPRFSHVYMNMSNGTSARGPWNQGQGPWRPGESWVYVEDVVQHVMQTQGMTVNHPAQGTQITEQQAQQMSQELGKKRKQEIQQATGHGSNQWSAYGQQSLHSPPQAQGPVQ